MRLLLVEDDDDIADTLKAYLERQGFVVDRASSLDMARDVIATDSFDLVLLDRMLPDGDGTELIEYARVQDKPQRFLVLSARDSVNDRVMGLDMGAHDYVIKPFEPRELVARIRAALRQDLRSHRRLRQFGELVHDADDNTFSVASVPLTLRRSEALVLSALMQRPGAVMLRETLETSVYGYDKLVNANSLESTISRLRKTLAQTGAGVEIAVVRGLGYRLLKI